MDNKTIKISVIEDSIDDTALIKRKLETSARAHFQMTFLRTLHEALEQLAREHPDVIISDLGLPDSHGLDTVHKILEAAPRIPLVVLSGFDDESAAMQAVQAGAQDYLVKGQIENPQLERSLFYSIERARLQTEIEKHAGEITIFQANMQKILEKDTDALLVVGADKKILYANPAVKELTGQLPKELISKLFSYELTSGKTLEIEIIQPDKTEKTAEMSVTDIDWEGKPASLVSMHDMTKRKHMERAVKRSEEKFAAAFRSSPDIIIIVDAKTDKILEVNESFTRATGWTREEALGRTQDELNIRVYPEETVKMKRHLQQSGALRQEELSFRDKHGGIHLWTCSAEIFNFEDETCVMFVSSDITRHKQIEKNLIESEEKFSKVFQHSPEVILITSLEDDTVLEANDTFVRLTGYSRGEAIGRKFPEMGFWADPQDRETMIKTIKERKIVSNRELNFRMKSGEIRTWLFSGEIINIGGQLRVLSVSIDITERKKMEDMFRFSDVALRSIHEGIIAMDKNLRITHWNEISEQLFGVKASDAMGKEVSDVCKLAEEYEGQNKERTETLVKRGFIHEEQHYHTARGGIWVDAQSQAIEFNGKRFGWLTLLSDISAHKKAEEALKQSEEKYRELINASPDGIISADSDMNITIWNSSAEKIFGYTEKEMLGQSILKVIPDADKKTVEKGFNLVNKTVIPANAGNITEMLCVRKDGSHAPVEISLSTRKASETVIITGIVRDITRRKESEEALKQSEEKYRGLINTSNDTIISVNPQMKFIVWNTGAEKLFGYKEKEMLGQTIMTIFPADVQKTVVKELIQLKQFGTTIDMNDVFETTVMRKDSSRVPVDVSVSARKSGEVFIITAIMRDITMRKEAEAKLRQIDQMKSEFLSNVSHELRTPLQSISGFTKLIMNGEVPDSKTQQEFLQIIDQETLHLGNLINSLLDMSRLESGRFQIHRQPAPMRNTIIDSLKMFQSLARQKNIELIEKISSEIPEMHVDNERMRQVIINLLSNAIKFSNHGGKVTISAGTRDGELFFQVADNGPGIREENMKHLFERFYQEEGDAVNSGMGLDRYISRQIIEAHGGRIWAESKSGNGSIFNFTLPLNGHGGNNHG